MRASIGVGIDRNSYSHRGSLYSCLALLDICFSNFIVAPLVVGYWCSTWITLKTLLLANTTVNVFVPIVFGFGLLVLFTTFQTELQVIFTEHVGNRFVYFVSSRLYTELFGIASVSSWYGVWAVFDLLNRESNVNITVSVVLISYVGLLCSKTVCNLTSSPFAIITDKKQGYFDVPTRFQWSYHWKKNKLLFVLDSICSVFIVGTLVILMWRGAWCLLDQVLFPGRENYKLTGCASLAIGYLIVFFTFLLKSLVKMLIQKYGGWRRLIILDIYVVISFCGTINIWRGIWILLEIYTDIEHNLRNCIVLHFLSFFILVIFNASNTLLVRGVYIDAEENDDDCVEFPCYYFRLRFQEKEQKKFLAQLNESHMRRLRTTSDDEDSVKHPMVTEFIDQEPDDCVEEDKRPNNNNINSDPDREKLDERAIDSTLKEVISAAEANTSIIPVPV